MSKHVFPLMGRSHGNEYSRLQFSELQSFLGSFGTTKSTNLLFINFILLLKSSTSILLSMHLEEVKIKEHNS